MKNPSSTRLVLVITVWIFVLSGCSKPVTIHSLVKEMADRKQLTFFPSPEYTHRQFSSYNRASVSPGEKGWFENFDMSHFIRVEKNNGRREFVMFDADGPGAVVRWWMTFYKAQNGIIRVYLDHATDPVISGAPHEVLSGHQLAGYPFSVSLQDGALRGEEGRDYDHNFYLPLPFAEHCKITYECDSLVMLFDYEGIPVPQGYYWPDVFYNIGYRSYSKRTKVVSFSEKALNKEQSLLDLTGKDLLDGHHNINYEQSFCKTLAVGDSLVIEFKRSQHAVNSLVLELEASNMPQALRSTVLKASFDGYGTVWVPVGEFFGTGYSLAPFRTWMNQRDEYGKMSSFRVMPFRERCSIVLINYGKEPVSLKGSAGLTRYRWKGNSMYFGASWHEYYHILSRDENGMPFDLNFIDIQGKGVYVGDQVTLFNNTYKWWGEGDEKIFVDGESFPSSFGTGSEDYYGYSFARQETFSHPFLAQPIGIGNMARGITVNSRHRSLDAIPFHTSISSNIELWHWDCIKMNYALTSFYYLLPPFTRNIVPDIESVQRSVALSGKDFVDDID